MSSRGYGDMRVGWAEDTNNREYGPYRTVYSTVLYSTVE
jgi:hypothetical protein